MKRLEEIEMRFTGGCCNEEVLRKNGNEKGAYNYNQIVTAEMFRTHNEEREFAEFDTHRQVGEREIYLASLWKWISE